MRLRPRTKLGGLCLRRWEGGALAGQGGWEGGALVRWRGSGCVRLRRWERDALAAPDKVGGGEICVGGRGARSGGVAFVLLGFGGGGVAAFHGVGAGGVGVAFVLLMLGGVGRFGGFFTEY